jgi:hypothetical protein
MTTEIAPPGLAADPVLLYRILPLAVAQRGLSV